MEKFETRRFFQIAAAKSWINLRKADFYFHFGFKCLLLQAGKIRDSADGKSFETETWDKVLPVAAYLPDNKISSGLLNL